MKVMIDNNVAIDALKSTPGVEANAKRIFQLIGQDKISPYMCANSLTDIFYVLSKAQGKEKARGTIANLIKAMNVVPLTAEDCSTALTLPIGDFEDALIAVCAKKAGADCIVSRDEAFIKAHTDVEAIKPGQLLARLK